MKGLKLDLKTGEAVDWAALTKEMRILDSGKLYSQGEPWQFEIDNAIANYKRVYLQLARGHDKTDRFAWWSMLWLSSTVTTRGYAAGVDRDNAALFRDSSKKLKSLHPDLFYAIDIQKNMVINKETGSWIETISSDADSAYGLNFDLLIVNDFHAWPNEKFWEVLWTACGKKSDIRIWIESNALTLGSEGAHWVNKFRQWVKEEGTKIDWWFYKPKGFLATWQQLHLAQWQKTLHPSTYKRLIENEDVSGEESFVTSEQVETIIKEKETVERKGIIVTGADLGLKKDATAIATVCANPTIKGASPSYTLLALDSLTGSFDNPVQLRYVEELILLHRSKYKSRLCLIDPWNAASLIQKYSWIQEWPFTVAHVRELTQSLYRAIADKHLTIYKRAGRAIQDEEEWDLERELTNAVLKDCSYGQRIDHRAGGYSDRIIALGMAIHYLTSEVHIPKVQEKAKEKDEDYWIKQQIKEWLEVDNSAGLLRIR